MNTNQNSYVHSRQNWKDLVSVAERLDLQQLMKFIIVVLITKQTWILLLYLEIFPQVILYKKGKRTIIFRSTKLS